MDSSQVATGTVEGTGSLIIIQCGWQPDYVIVQNIDSTSYERIEWFQGMTKAHGLKTKGNVRSKITTRGISLYAGTEAGNGEGFTIGADTDLNVAAETISWRAVRGD